MSVELETADHVSDVIERAEHDAHTAVREPLVYTAGDIEGSFYADLYRRERKQDTEARERLERHEKQMLDIPSRHETRTFYGARYEFRAPLNKTAGRGEEFTPPLWLNELFATARRPGQVLQRLAPTFDLPKGAGSIHLPRITQGTVVEPTIAATPEPSQDVETAEVESPVATFSGISDWAIQALEQSPAGAHLDWVVFRDMTESLDAEIERELLVGSGTNEHFFGLLELAGTNSIEYTSEEPTGTAMFPFVGRALAQIGVKRRLPPEIIMMNTSRFFWLSTSEDLANRPLLLEDYEESTFPIAGLSGVGVYPNNAIPNTLTKTENQDAIICCRPSDFVLFASEPYVTVKEDVLSGTLQVRFELHRYVAAILGRFPSGISKVTGTGMVVQEGFK